MTTTAAANGAPVDIDVTERALLPPPRDVDSTPDPAARAAETCTRVTLLSRLRAAWRAFLCLDGITPREEALSREVAGLRDDLYSRDVLVFGLRHTLAQKQSEVLILQKEVELWCQVHERDRACRERDQALYDATIALARPPALGEGG